MQKIAKYVLVIMTLMMILGSCAQGNSSDNSGNTPTNSSTGIVGRWATSEGVVVEFGSDGILYGEHGDAYGEYRGNNAEGEINHYLLNKSYYYTIFFYIYPTIKSLYPFNPAEGG